MNGNRSAVRHWPTADRQGPSILKFVHEVAGIGMKRLRHSIGYVFLRILGGAPGCDPSVQNLWQCCARLYFIWVEAIHRAVEIVCQNKSFVGSEHANSMGHVRQGRVQKHIGMLETLLCAVAQKLT